MTLTPGAQSDQQQRKSAATAVTVAEAILSKSPSMTAMASAQAVSNMVAKKIGNHDPLRCFALVLWRPESEDEAGVDHSTHTPRLHSVLVHKRHVQVVYSVDPSVALKDDLVSNS